MRTILIFCYALCTTVTYTAAGQNVDTLPYKSTVYFTKQQLQQDILFMHRKMEEVHPNLYHSVTKEAYTQLRDSLANTLPDSLTASDAWPKLARLVAAINEGHTMLHGIKDEMKFLKESGYPLFPVNFKTFDGKHLIVREDASTESVLQTGDKVTAINGLPASTLMALFTAAYGGLQNWKELNALQDFIVAMYRHQLTAPYRIQYLSGNSVKEVVYKGMPYPLYAERLKAIRKSTQAKQVVPYTFERLEGNVGYLNLRTFGTDYKRFDSFLQAAFNDLKTNGIKGLIIDLRKNGGGNSELGNRLLHFITGKPYRMSGGVSWKVSQPYKDFISNMDSATKASFSFYTQKQNGAFITDEATAKAPPANALRYKGPVCVLIGPNTFSSANMLAVTIKDFDLATLIGEPTGEPGNDYGETLTMQLPHTGIPFVTSTKQFIRPNGDTKDNGAIEPHILVKTEANHNNDNVKAYAIQWVLKQPAVVTNKRG